MPQLRSRRVRSVPARNHHTASNEDYVILPDLSPREVRYGSVVADPPWPYENAERGAIIKSVLKNGGIASGVHMASRYGSMSIADLCAMPIAALCEKNAHLYLWTTNAFMDEAHDVARAWGFKPKTIITWVKVHNEDLGRPSMKTGYYYRSATEHILFCVRGSLALSGPPEPTAVLAPRNAHSVKPGWSYTMIERQSPGPYLDVFARITRPGWDSFGNQIEPDLLSGVS